MTPDDLADGRQPRPEVRLLEELARIGVNLQSIWSTLHVKVMPPAAFRIMLKHLMSDYPARTREGIARALARREARDVIWDELIELYRQLPEDNNPGRVKEGVAASLHRMARRTDAAVLSDLISDPKHGRTRIFFVKPLAKSQDPTALRLLERLRKDEDLKKEIDFVLRKRSRSSQLAMSATRNSTH